LPAASETVTRTTPGMTLQALASAFIPCQSYRYGGTPPLTDTETLPGKCFSTCEMKEFAPVLVNAAWVLAPVWSGHNR
jgi:hypothetical protein